MKCPNCSKEMVEKSIGDIKIDYCENGCEGLWFDWLELKKLDESHEGNKEDLEEILKSESKSNPEINRKLKCPKCNAVMHEHRYKMANVLVDECYACGGFFLDAGELKIIRNEYKGKKDLEEKLDLVMFQEFAGDIFKEQKIRIREEEERIKRNRRRNRRKKF